MEIGNKKLTNNYLFWDKRIDKRQSESYQLLIHYDYVRFSYCIFDIENKEFLSINSNQINDIQDLKLLLENKVFSWEYESVKINIESNKSTILPNSFFEEKIIEKYLYFNENINKNEISFFWDELKYMDAIVAYSLPQKLISFLMNKFEKSEIKSNSSIFIDSILRRSAQSNKNEIFIDLSEDRFDMGIAKKSKLFLYNHFAFSSKNDFLYYILNCYNTLNLDPKKDTLYISGEFEESQIIPDLREYLHNIVLQKRGKEFIYSNVLNKIPEFYFQKLFNLTTCV